MPSDDQSKTPITPGTDGVNEANGNPISNDLAFELDFEENKNQTSPIEIPEITINNDDLASILDDTSTEPEINKEDENIGNQETPEIGNDWNLSEKDNKIENNEDFLPQESNQEEIKNGEEIELNLGETINQTENNEEINSSENTNTESSHTTNSEENNEEEKLTTIDTNRQETSIEEKPEKIELTTNEISEEGAIENGVNIDETSKENKTEEIELTTNEISEKGINDTGLDIDELAKEAEAQAIETNFSTESNGGINIDSMISKLEKNVETSVEKTQEDLIKIPEAVSSNPGPFSAINLNQTTTNQTTPNEYPTSSNSKKVFLWILIILLAISVFFYINSAYPVETANLTDNILRNIRSITQTTNSTGEATTGNTINENFLSGETQKENSTNSGDMSETGNISILPEELSSSEININSLKDTLILQQSQAKDYMTIAKEKKNGGALRNSILIVRKTSTYLQTIDTATTEEIEKIKKDSENFEKILGEIKLSIDEKAIISDGQTAIDSTGQTSTEDLAEKEFEKLLQAENTP